MKHLKTFAALCCVAALFAACEKNDVEPTAGDANGHEYVDLGLSVKWATCNIGATTPEGYGDYFAWGESDPAHVNWGGAWRMPTNEEWEELRSNCTWTWTTLNGIKGYEVIGPNGGSIFLPAAGCRSNDGFSTVVDGIGYYWSLSLGTSNSSKAWNTNFNSEYVSRTETDRRYVLSVRAVAPVELPVELQQVDLNLPSGTKWANLNIGATTPEDYGDYFAWGETKPQEMYTWEAYKWCNDKYDALTKYNTSSSFGTVDNKTVLDPESDAARINWGGSWRMPTDAEWQELRDNCTWTWTTLNGINGVEVKGSNGNAIFLPAAGFRSSNDVFYTGHYGCYWSSSLDTTAPSNAKFVEFQSEDNDIFRNYYSRVCGQSVRAVMK